MRRRADEFADHGNAAAYRKLSARVREPEKAHGLRPQVPAADRVFRGHGLCACTLCYSYREVRF